MRAAGVSQSSIHQTYTPLNGTMKWARSNRMVSRNPVADAEEPRSTAVPREVARGGTSRTPREAVPGPVPLPPSWAGQRLAESRPHDPGIIGVAGTS
jgi:hypothetical protein